MAAILVIDGNPPGIPCFVRDGHAAGHDVELVADWEGARRAISRRRPDAILVARLAGDVLRNEMCRQLRQTVSPGNVAIVAMVPASAPRTRVRCLEDGADDVLDQDVSPPRLWARVAALIAMVNRWNGGNRLAHGAIEMSVESHRVFAAGSPITLNRTSFAILRAFLERPETILSRCEISRILGRARALRDRTVDAHIRTLRRAMRPAGVDDLIVTVPQAGYMLRNR